MASLRVIPYSYVPTKQRLCNNDQHSSVDKHPRTHHITQQSKPGVLPEKEARREIQDPTSVLNAEVSLSGVVADQDALSRETDYSQVELTDNGTVDIDPSSDFDVDFDSIFGNIDALFEEQEVSSVIECNSSHTHTDASADHTDNLASEKESAKTDAPSSCSYQLTKRRTTTKRRREEDNSSVVISDSNSDSRASDESDNESIFEVRQSKSSRSGSPISSLDLSIYSSDVEEVVAKSGKRLSIHHLVPVTDLIERENESPTIGPRDTSNLIHNTNPQIDDGGLDNDDDDDELCHSPSWYRFGPSPAKSHSDDVLLRRCYVAQVEDACRHREFHNIIGKEYIDGEVHYMVDWVPTLVRGHVLRKAQAQPLISSFEARCQPHNEGGKGHGNGRSNGYKATDLTQQRKRRGRLRRVVGRNQINKDEI